MNGQRSALGILLDATELMVARDVSQGRTMESAQRALEAAHATLTHVATTIGLTPPADYEKLKAAAVELVAKLREIPELPPTVDLAAIAKEWFGEHPYDEDEVTDEAIGYFESFQSPHRGVLPGELTGEVAQPAAGAEDIELAAMLRNLLADHGISEAEMLAKAKGVLYQLRNDASAHRAKLGDSMEVATLKRKLAEAEGQLGELRAGLVFVPVAKKRGGAKRGRKG